MKSAGWLAILVAAVLWGAAIVQVRNAANEAPQRITEAYAAMDSGDQSLLDEQSADANRTREVEMIEGIAGAAFMVAGIALIGRARKTETA
ncbi:MAG TPA: hypothetical protein VGT04_07050 [Acidobacteriaceae bacterium]|nr:hypothetical protein [Acidobacteriaceae bacterium]